MNNRMKKAAFATAFITGLTATSFAAWEISASSVLSNRYVTEGVSNDPDSSAYIFNEVSLTLDAFTVGAWYAQSLRGSSYNEVNLFAEYGFAMGEVDIFAGINFLTFPTPGDSDTWELYLGVHYRPHENVVLFLDTYYDIDEVRGGFLWVGAAFPFAPFEANDRWELEPYVRLGVDYGYVSGPRRLRENNFEIGLFATYTLNDNADLFAGVHHSFRLKNLRDEGEGDVTWVEAGVSFAF